jgi:hypothetical protein
MMLTVGRIVLLHHVEDQKDYPAIVVDIEDDGDPHLYVFRARGPYFTRAAEGTHGGGWSWLPRETS